MDTQCDVIHTLALEVILPQSWIIYSIIKKNILHYRKIRIIVTSEKRISSVRSDNIFFDNTLNFPFKLI